MVSSKFILLGLLLVFLSGALGHSYLTNPISRSNQKQSNTGCRGPNCLGPCDVKQGLKSNTKAITIARGDSISVQWPRNNHAGGFIRIAWTQTSQSDSHTAFDAGVQEIFCHEVGGCKPDNPSDPNGGDSAPTDGSFQPCKMSITVPLHLTDGSWTMQWAWFGGAFALGDYYSCVDYTISGGPSGSQLDAFFIGGDYTYPNQNKCKFFNTDRLHQCVNEPCNKPIYALNQQQNGPAYGVAAQGNLPPIAVTTSKVTKITTGAATPQQVTTGRPVPQQVTTGRSVPQQVTTGAPPSRPVTTGVKSITTGLNTGLIPQPIPNGNSANCAALSAQSSSIASISAIDTWGTTIRMVVQINVVEDMLNNWRLQVIWPTNAVSTRVTRVYNAGALQCEATSPTRHAIIQPAAAWANNLHSGAVVMVEVMATNTNMNSQFIMANTQLRVLTA